MEDPMAKKILIIGATGSIGLEVAKRLIEKDQSVRIAVRNPDKAKSLKLNGAEVIHFEYQKPETFFNTFESVEKILLVSPPSFLKLHKDVINAINVAKDNGVKLIVNVSAMGIENDENDPMRIIENHIQKSGLKYVLLRPNCYMQNFTNLFRDYIKNDNEISAPAEDAKSSFVDLRDVADAAVKVLLDDYFHNKIFTLTGNKALNLHVIAYLFSQELDREISYSKISEEFFKKTLISAGWPSITIEGALELCNYIKGNSNDRVTDDIKKILDREPISFEQFIKENIEIWK